MLNIPNISSGKKSRIAIVIISWILLIGWVAFIYLTLGTVPIWRETLVERYGQGVFATITYIAGGIGGAIILVLMIIRNREKQALPYLSLVGTLLFLIYVMRYWIVIPVEQIHFIEYSLVGFLAYNSLRHHLKG